MIQRYEMVGCTRFGEAWQSLEEDPDGAWCRYADTADAALFSAAQQALKWLETNSSPWTAVQEIAALRSALKTCERCCGTGLVTIHGGGSGDPEWDADDQPCPECSAPSAPPREKAQ